MVQTIISLAFALISAALLTLCSIKMLQMYQLSSYKTAGFYSWIKRTGGDYLIRYFALAFFQFISTLIFCFSFPDSHLRFIGVAIYIALGIFFVLLQKRQIQKTPLKFTKRIIRQIVILSVLFFVLSFLTVYFTYNLAIGYSLLAVWTLLIAAVVALSHFMALPIELFINSRYIKKAKAALSTQIIKIGITGSYGKTTSKNILAAMLAQKYKVLSSPASHNTPMGICKLINAGIEGYQVLIAEMGARQKGDIDELCRIVNPDYGVITVTGAAHLETFGNIDEIVKTKLELSRHAGIVVLNSDDKKLMEAASLMVLSNAKASGHTYGNGSQNANCAQQVEIVEKSEMARASEESEKSKSGKCSFLYSGTAGADATYSDVKVSSNGTTFTIQLGGRSATDITVLLGRHIPSLFAQCALLASHLGLTLEQITKAAAEVRPVEHRLQLIKTPYATVIDDAYNANPEGAKNALEVLSLFEGTKVLITPGFVEMGRHQEEHNKVLGEQAARSADYLISVGSKDITAGAREAGMDESRIFEESSLTAATERLAVLALTNPIILFLNDLPDNY